MARGAQSTGDLEAVLGVRGGASAADVRAAYRRAVLAAHPDKGGTSEQFQRVTIAFEVLSERAGRAEARSARPRAAARPAAARPGAAARPAAARPAAARSRGGQPGAGRPPPEEAGEGGGGAAGAEASAPAAASASLGPKAARAAEGLQRCLQALPVDVRREAIARLEGPVRAALLAFMESRPRQPPRPPGWRKARLALCDRRPAACPAGGAIANDDNVARLGAKVQAFMGRRWRRGCKRQAGDEAASGQKRRASHETPLLREPSPPSAVRGQARPRGSGTEEVPAAGRAEPARQRQKGVRFNKGSFEVTVYCGCLILHTRYQREFAVAVEHHIALVQIKGFLVSRFDLRQEWPVPEVMAGVQDVLREADMSQGDLRAKVMMNSFRGAIFKVASPVVAFEEAVAIRNRLFVARRRSWDAMRSECVALLLHPAAWARRSRAEAEAAVDALWDAQRARRAAARARAAAARTVERQHQRVQARLARWAARLRAALASARWSAARAARRQRAEAARVAKARGRERYRWSMRRDLTFEQLLRGPPGALGRTGARARDAGGEG